jgi:aminoglycoside phosphotransferase family enzyme/predicted kinase
VLPAALLDPAVYPHPAPAPTLLETHISWVVLAGEFAYKIKRPVHYPFLDYSSAALRRAACRTEVDLNRRWAPDLYLGVAELALTAEGPRFDRPGTPLEAAVRMRRFDRALELDALLARGAVDPQELAALGAAVAGWQAASPVVAAAAPWGTPAEALAAVEENLATLRAPGLPLPAGVVAALAAWVSGEHGRVAPLLAARRAAGRVRECHGDLHSRNVVRWGGQLTPFDGIDFAARLRFIDVASDVAFLAMDLERLGRADLGAAFFDGWLAASGDFEAAQVWRWFLAYRALVRAKVDALRALQLGRAPAAAAAWSECRRFIAAAHDYTVRAPGTIVITCGPSGSGKSGLAAALVTALGAVRIRSDVERKRLAGLPADASSASPLDQGLYAPAATRRIYARLAALADGLARAGVNVLVDATYLDPGERRAAAAAARAAGARFAILECTAPPAVLRERVAARRADPSEATLEVLEQQLRSGPALTAAERRCAVQVDTTGSTDAAALATALRAAAAPPGDSPHGAAPGS